jgi:hypothetical protein
VRTSFVLNLSAARKILMVDKTKRSGDSKLMDARDVLVYTAGDGKVAFFEKNKDSDEDDDNKAWLSSEQPFDTRDWR